MILKARLPMKTDLEKTLSLLQEMEISNVRFPGGGFTPYYHWKDGIGPKKKRPVTQYTDPFLNPPYNEFGTDEFIKWCQKVGCKPYICVNMGSDTSEEARDWVDERVKNGHSTPYNVKYWAVGNEINGIWEYRYTEAAEEYVKKAREYCRVMKATDLSIKIVLIGIPTPNDWNFTVLNQLYRYVDYISFHHYVGPENDLDHDGKNYYKVGIERTHEIMCSRMNILDDQ
ncbi:MAG: hypothetical protein ACLU62_11260 [Hydrogeniiclostridium sp.]